jgi:hypothetical protein
MDKIVVRLDDSYCPRIDESIGELLGSEITLDKFSPEYKPVTDNIVYRYRCPLIVVLLTPCCGKFNSRIEILGVSGSSDKCETPSVGIRESLLKINNRYTQLPAERMNNPIYQLLESILCNFGIERSWKGFKSVIINRKLTITLLCDEADCVILSETISVNEHSTYYRRVIKKILAEMRDGTSELLQYSFKRMKSARN